METRATTPLYQIPYHISQTVEAFKHQSREYMIRIASRPPPARASRSIAPLTSTPRLLIPFSHSLFLCSQPLLVVAIAVGQASLSLPSRDRVCSGQDYLQKASFTTPFLLVSPLSDPPTKLVAMRSTESTPPSPLRPKLYIPTSGNDKATLIEQYLSRTNVAHSSARLDRCGSFTIEGGIAIAQMARGS